MSAALVTGAAGFIGSHICEHLLKSIPVVAVDKLSYCSNRANVPAHAKFVHGDLTDYRFVQRLFREHNFRYVVHLAAESHVDNSFKFPSVFMHNNVGATQCLLDAASEANVTKFLNFSTDEVYGPCELATETSPLAPTNPYAASKAASEVVAGTWSRCFGVPLVTIRSNNVFGPRQYPEKIIPKFIKRLRAGQPCIVHGSGQHMRSYVHVSDVARAVELVLDKGVLGEVYNLGTDNELSNLALAHKLTAMLGGPPPEFGPDRLFNDSRYRVDWHKLEALGWTAEVDFEQGLQRVVQAHQ